MKDALRELDKDTRDEDYHLGAFVELPKISDVPESFNMGDAELFDQQTDCNDDMCPACATCGASSFTDETTFYYPFVFAASKVGQDPDSWGQDLRSIAKAWQDYGSLSKDDLTSKSLSPRERRIVTNYTPAERIEAKKYIKPTYTWVRGPYDSYDNIKVNLYALYLQGKKWPVVLGVRWGWNLSDYIIKGTPDGSGHALYITGWDKDGLILVNSYGTRAGINGRHRIQRDTVNAYVPKFGALILTDIPLEEAKRRIKDNQMQQLTLIGQILTLLWDYLEKVKNRIGQIL